MTKRKEQVELKAAGLKVTEPRKRILEVFREHPDRHLRAEEVYQSLKDTGFDVGFATVYRVLTQFEQAGIIVRHHFESGYSVFELDQGEHHDHLVCCECGRVEEFVDAVIEARQEEIAVQAGYKMTNHALHIYGICQDCQKNS